MRKTSGLNWQSYSLVPKKQDHICNMVLIALDKYATSIIHNFQHIISPPFHEEKNKAISVHIISTSRTQVRLQCLRGPQHE